MVPSLTFFLDDLKPEGADWVILEQVLQVIDVSVDFGWWGWLNKLS